jgi:hypothetical protein
MLSSVNAAYVNGGKLVALSSGAQDLQQNRAQNKGASEQTTSTGIKDTVTLSPTAQSLLAGTGGRSVEYYEGFFPTREGYSAKALATAIVDPGAESISKGKTIEEVGTAARASLDQKYASMNASDQKFDPNRSEGKDWYSAFGELDRRALYAVSMNQNGQFTKEEQDIAQSLMSGQQAWAMGMANGPARLVEGIPDAFGGDHAARFKAATKWLDKVSADEKTSIPWTLQRAANQSGYESIMRDRGQPAESLDSNNPLVKLIKSAIETMKNDFSRGITRGSIQTSQDLKNQPWFEGFQSRLDGAIQQTKDLYARRA